MMYIRTLILSVVFVTCGAFAAEQPNVLFPLSQKIQHLNLLDVKDNGDQLLFSSPETEIEGVDDAYSSSYIDLYVYEVTKDLVTKVTLSHDEKVALGDSGSGHFVGDNRILFTSAATNLVEGERGVEGQLYSYDIPTKTISKVIHPSGFVGGVSQIVPTKVQDSVYIRFGSSLFSYNLGSKNWTPINITLYHYLPLRNTADSGSLLAMNKAGYYSIVELDGSTRDIGVSHTTSQSASLSPDANKLSVWTYGLLTTFDLTASALDSDLFVVSHPLIESFDTFKFAISSDRRYIAYLAYLVKDLDEPNYRSKKAALFVTDVTTGKTVLASGRDIKTAKYFDNVQFAASNDAILYKQHDSLGKTRFISASFDDLSFNSDVSASPDIKLLNTEPFHTQISVESTGGASHFAVNRVNQNTGSSENFYFSEASLDDYRKGLSPDDYLYEFLPCDEYLRCDDSKKVTKTVAVKGFEQAIDLEVVGIKHENKYKLKARSGELSGTHIHYVQYGVKEQFQPRSFPGITLDVEDDQSYAVAARQCIQNIDNSYSCDDFSETVVDVFPKLTLDENFIAKPRPDFASVFVSWRHIEAADYHRLHRVVNGKRRLVSWKRNGQVYDTDAELGAEMYYEMEVCLQGRCSTSQSNLITFDRVEYPLQLFSESQGVYNKLTIEAHYGFEKFFLYRTPTDQSGGEKLVVELKGTRTEYLDYGIKPGKEYVYRIEGCFQNECTANGFSLAKTKHYETLTPLPKIPSLTSVKADYFMAANLKWSSVDNADGYLLDISVPALGKTETIRLEGQDTSQYVDHIDDYGFEIQYSVKSFKKAIDSNEIEYASPPSNVTTFRSIRTANVDQHFPKPIINSSLYANGSVLVEWQEGRFDEYYKIFLKSSADDSFEQVTTVNQYNTRWLRYLTSPGLTYQLALKSCSILTDSCSELSEAVELKMYDSATIPRLTEAPLLSWEDDKLIVEPKIPASDSVYRVNVEYRFADSNVIETDYGTEYDASFEYVPNHKNISSGDMLFVRTNYCFSSQLIAFCSDWSEESEFKFSEDTSVLPVRPEVNLGVVTTDNAIGKVYFSVPSYDTGYLAPDRANIYVVLEGAYPTRSQTLTELTYVDGKLSFSGVEDVQLGSRLSLQAELCNIKGCGPVSALQHVDVNELSKLGRPSTPAILSLQNLGESGDVEMRFSKVDYVEEYLITANRVGENGDYPDPVSKSRIPYYLDYDVMEHLKGGEFYDISIKACNSHGCSEESEVTRFYVEPRIKTSYTISGAELRYAPGSLSLAGSHNWTASYGSVQAFQGRLDTVMGKLHLNQWLDASKGFQLTNAVYLSPAEVSTCENLLQVKGELKNAKYTFEGYESNLYSIFYTGKGCDHSPDLDRGSIYLDSDFLAKPVKIFEGVSRFQEWSKIEFKVDAQGNASIEIQDIIYSLAASKFDFDLWGAFYLNWQTGSQSAISHTKVRSFTDADPKTRPQVNTFAVSSIQPEFAVLYRTGGDKSEVRLFVEDVETQKLTLDSYSQETSGSFLSGLTPGTNYTYLARSCNEFNRCTPFKLGSFKTHNYGPIPRFSAPGLSRVGPYEEGSISLYLNFNVEGYGNSWKLSVKKATGEGEAQTLFNWSTQDLIEALAESPGLYSAYRVNDLVPGEDYVFNYEICNPVECETADTDLEATAPIDTDQDGVIDVRDDFPDDPSEHDDADQDGVGNNADNDDDNDGLSDARELELGLDPLNEYDVLHDSDDDGYLNLIEIMSGSDIWDPESIPSHYATFMSFEPEDDVRTISLKGMREIWTIYGRFLPHGNFYAAVPFHNHSEEVGVMEFNGETLEGKVYFAFQGDVAQLQILVDGAATAFNLASPREYGDFYFYEFPVSEGEHKIEWKLKRATSKHDSKADKLDTVIIPTGEMPSNVHHDFDNDFRSDIVLRDTATGDNFVWFVDSFNEPDVSGLSIGNKKELAPNISSEWSMAASGDFNGDGFTDFTWRNAVSGDVRVWLYRYGERFANIKVASIQEPDWKIIAAGKFNSDQTDDILLRNSKTGANLTWQMVDGAIANRVYLPKNSDAQWKIASVGDLDSDGIDDLLWQHQGTGETSYWILAEGGEVSRVRLLDYSQSDWIVEAINDFDGNGNNDILWRNQHTNEIRFWFQDWTYDLYFDKFKVPAFKSLDWEIVATGNYDRSPTTDILWRNKATGNMVIFLLESYQGDFKRFAIDPEPNLDRQVVSH